MKIQRNVIIKTLLSHGFEKDFFKFIDYIHHHDTANEFPQMDYVRFFEEKVRPLKDNSVSNIMSLDVLIASGIFEYFNKNTGRITLSKAIYELLTFLDISRSKQYGGITFREFRDNIDNVVTDIKASPVGSDDYIEAEQHFNKIIGEILSEIQQNIHVLDLKVAEIAKLYKEKEQGNSDISIGDLYERAEKLYTRNLLPCIEFINPDFQIQGKTTFLENLLALKQHYDAISHPELSVALQYRMTAVTSYYKDIQVVSERLKRYLSSLAEERKYFMVLENAFSELTKSVEALQHGKHHNKFLSADSDIAGHLSSLDGLSSFKQRYSQRLNRQDEKSLLQFKVYLENIHDQPLVSNQTNLKPLPPDNNMAYKREKIIMNHMLEAEIADTMIDIYAYVYDFLRSKLSDFSLFDLLKGIEFYLPLLDTDGVHRANRRAQLDDGTYFVDYAVLMYKKINHTQEIKHSKSKSEN